MLESYIDRSKRGAVFRCRKRSCVAMRENATARPQERKAILTYRTAYRDILSSYSVSFFSQYIFYLIDIDFLDANY